MSLSDVQFQHRKSTRVHPGEALPFTLTSNSSRVVRRVTSLLTPVRFGTLLLLHSSLSSFSALYLVKQDGPATNTRTLCLLARCSCFHCTVSDGAPNKNSDIPTGPRRRVARHSLSIMDGSNCLARLVTDTVLLKTTAFKKEPESYE